MPRTNPAQSVPATKPAPSNSPASTSHGAASTPVDLQKKLDGVRGLIPSQTTLGAFDQDSAASETAVQEAIGQQRGITKELTNVVTILQAILGKLKANAAYDAASDVQQMQSSLDSLRAELVRLRQNDTKRLLASHFKGRLDAVSFLDSNKLSKALSGVDDILREIKTVKSPTVRRSFDEKLRGFLGIHRPVSPFLSQAA